MENSSSIFEKNKSVRSRAWTDKTKVNWSRNRRRMYQKLNEICRWKFNFFQISLSNFAGPKINQWKIIRRTQHRFFNRSKSVERLSRFVNLEPLLAHLICADFDREVRSCRSRLTQHKSQNSSQMQSPGNQQLKTASEEKNKEKLAARKKIYEAIRLDHKCLAYQCPGLNASCAAGLKWVKLVYGRTSQANEQLFHVLRTKCAFSRTFCFLLWQALRMTQNHGLRVKLIRFSCKQMSSTTKHGRSFIQCLSHGRFQSSTSSIAQMDFKPLITPGRWISTTWTAFSSTCATIWRKMASKFLFKRRSTILQNSFLWNFDSRFQKFWVCEATIYFRSVWLTQFKWRRLSGKFHWW